MDDWTWGVMHPVSGSLQDGNSSLLMVVPVAVTPLQLSGIYEQELQKASEILFASPSLLVPISFYTWIHFTIFIFGKSLVWSLEYQPWSWIASVRQKKHTVWVQDRNPASWWLCCYGSLCSWDCSLPVCKSDNDASFPSWLSSFSLKASGTQHHDYRTLTCVRHNRWMAKPAEI